MSRVYNLFMKKLLFVFLLLFLLFISIIIYNQENIMKPTTRVLQAYHYDWLEHPLGGAFAISNVAHSKHKFKAMVVVATFDRLDVVLKRKSVSIFGGLFGELLYHGLEKSLALFYGFHPSHANSVKIAETITIPLYMVHGKKDELIFYQQGKKLFDAFASKEKVFYLDVEGDHHNILVTGHEFYKESGLFLLGETE